MDEKHAGEVESTTDRGKQWNECFFSEAAFLRVMGPGPSLQERLHAIASRPRAQEQKDKIKIDIDRSIFDSLPCVVTAPKIRKVDERIEDETSIERDNVAERISNGEEEESDKVGSPKKFDSIEDESTSETLQRIDSNVTQEDVTRSINIDSENSNVDKHCSIEDEKPTEAHCNSNDIINEPKTTNSSKEKDCSKDSLDCNEGNVHPSLNASKEAELSDHQKSDDDVCCLVMPRISDDESDEEDSKETEEPFCLIMPSISSDEMSSKEDLLDIDKRNPFNPPQADSKRLSLGSSSTKQAQFKTPDIPVTILPHQNQIPQKKQNSLQMDVLQTVANSTSSSFIKPGDNTKADVAEAKNPDPPVTVLVQPNRISPLEQKQHSTLYNDVFQTAANVAPSVVPHTSSTLVDDKRMAETNHVEAVDINSTKVSAQIIPQTAGPSIPKGQSGTKEATKAYHNVRSKLSKKQHKRYIQLYKRHVCPMMKGNRKTAYSEAELKELVELEELQQHVSQEQVEYQDYLKYKAMRNPNAYNYLTNTARIYAQSRYSSYHRPRNYIKNYEVDGLFTVPIVLEDKSESCFLTFQKTLLKLGNSARITIPDVRDGMNPTQIKADPSAIGAWFPTTNKNTNNKTMFMDHKMISEDNNAVKLAEEEEIDIVLSSSSFKCLLDNHGSNIMKAWDIPVTVRHNPFGGSNTVYLDKPLYRDDFLMRDLNAMYHKYALRTFVSRPRDKGISRIQANRSSNNQAKLKSRLGRTLSSDDHDMFSTGAVEDIETFGSFSSTSSRLSFDKSISGLFTFETEKRTDRSSLGFKTDSGVGITMPDQVRSSDRLFHSDKPQAENSPASSDSSNVSTVVSKTKSLSSGNQQSDTMCLRRSTRLSVSLESKASTNSPSSPDIKREIEPPAKVAKTDTGMCPTPSEESYTNEPKRKRGRPKQDQSANSTSAVEGNLSKQLVIDTESPASPPMLDIQSPLDHGRLVTDTPVEVPLSPIKGDADTREDKTAPSLLDSILGPSGDRPQASIWEQNVNNAPDIDNADDFLPLSEKCNHVIYNRWEMGPMKLMIRCNYHGAIKDKGKPRYVYLSPKMEYQPDSGMEQVTLNEMTRTWASCFIRPGTSLVRARINAFNSELLMVEEKTIEGILNPSLPFRPEHSFAVLRQIFEKLRRLPEGQYLLSHLKGDKICRVRKFNGKASVMPAPKKKRTGKAKEGQVPWIPIDPTILTPSHIHNSRIPATFMPSDWTYTVNRGPNGGGNKGPQGGGNKAPQGGGNKAPQGGGNKQPNQSWKGQNKNNQGQWKKPQAK